VKGLSEKRLRKGREGKGRQASHCFLILVSLLVVGPLGLEKGSGGKLIKLFWCENYLVQIYAFFLKAISFHSTEK
jgi:hypothetical protein